MISQECIDFYEGNKSLDSKLPQLPDGVVGDLAVADWLLNKSNFGWLELDLEFDLTAWQTESKIAKPYFVPHREYDNNKGWNSCCLHGIDISATGAWTNYGYLNENSVPYHWTSLSDQTPNIKSFWKNIFPTDNYRRVRFMELEADSAITPHSDMPGKLPGEQNFDALEFGVPVNIAVIHPEDCYMVLEGHGIVPFKPGKAFIVNIRNKHTVVNFSKQSRIHIIGHSFGYGTKKKDFVELVARSYNKQYEHSRV